MPLIERLIYYYNELVIANKKIHLYKNEWRLARATGIHNEVKTEYFQQESFYFFDRREY